MTTVVNVFEDDEDELLRSILRTVRRIEQKLDTYIRLDLTGDEAMALDIQALLDSASAISDVTEATQVALGQLAQELRDAAGDQEKVNAVADQLEANALAIGVAIASTDDVRDIPPAEVPTEPTPEVPSEPVPEPSPEPQPEPEVPSEPDPAPEPEPTPEGYAPVEEPPAGGIGGA